MATEDLAGVVSDFVGAKDQPKARSPLLAIVGLFINNSTIHDNLNHWHENRRFLIYHTGISGMSVGDERP